jgi:hypothetical protein
MMKQSEAFLESPMLQLLFCFYSLQGQNNFTQARKVWILIFIIFQWKSTTVEAWTQKNEQGGTVLDYRLN